MLILHDRLTNVPIMSLQTGVRLGVTTTPIIDPRRLYIVALYCQGSGIDFQPAILHTSDIREYSDIGLIINDSEDIMPPDDLVRLKEVIDFQFRLEGMRVVQEDGHKLGKVVDYATDTKSFYIIKLHVQPSLLQSLNAAEVLVDRSQIVNVTNDEIVVRRPVVKEEPAKNQLVRRVIDNPFRKPQAETSSTRQTEK